MGNKSSEGGISVFLRLREYHRPGDLAEALKLLGRSETHPRAMAGGTGSMGVSDDVTEAVVDLTGLSLRYITHAGQTIRLGALTTLADLVCSDAVCTIGDGILSRAAERVGPPVLRNRATIGGALSLPNRVGELVAVLLALDAWVVTARLGSGGAELVREGWGIGPFLERRRELLTNALIEEVQVPAMPVRGTVERIAITPGDTPIVSVAAVMARSGAARGIRLAATGLAAEPERLRAVEAELPGVLMDAEIIGHLADAARKAVFPPADFRGGIEYRRHLAGVLVQRALTAISASAGGR